MFEDNHFIAIHSPGTFARSTQTVCFVIIIVKLASTFSYHVFNHIITRHRSFTILDYLIIFDTILSLTESEAPELTWKQWIIHCLSTSLVVASQRCQLLPHKYVNHRAVNHLLPHISVNLLPLTSVNLLPFQDVNLLPHISLNLLPPKDVNHCRVAALSLRLRTICSTAVALQVCSAINEEVNLMPIQSGWVGTG